jgi:hypothetical protein
MIPKNEKWFKGVIIRENQRKKIIIFIGFLLITYIFQGMSQKKEGLNCFVNMFKELFENVQELILENLYKDTKVYCMQHKTLIINALIMTK